MIYPRHLWLVFIVCVLTVGPTVAQPGGPGPSSPLYGALLKNEQDVPLFEQLVFLHRRQGRQ